MLRIILVGVVSSPWLHESHVKSSHAYELRKNLIIGPTPDESSLECVCADDSAKWIFAAAIRPGDFCVGAPEERCSASCTSALEIEKHVSELRHRMLCEGPSAIQIVFFAIIKQRNDAFLWLPSA